MKHDTLIMLAGIAFGFWIMFGGDSPSDAPESGFMDRVYQSDRQARVEMVRDMRDREFSSPSEATDWVNNESLRIYEEQFAPFFDAVTRALATDRDYTPDDLIKDLQ